MKPLKIRQIRYSNLCIEELEIFEIFNPSVILAPQKLCKDSNLQDFAHSSFEVTNPKRKNKFSLS